jgi:hypothetical protein
LHELAIQPQFLHEERSQTEFENVTDTETAVYMAQVDQLWRNLTVIFSARFTHPYLFPLVVWFYQAVK